MAEVEFRLAGTFGVSVGGQRLEDGEIGSRKSRLLLELLVVRRWRSVQLDEIVELLWPQDAPERAADNVASLVSRLRRVLGTTIIRGGRVGYALADVAEVQVDVDEAERLTSEAQSTLDRAPALAVAATQRALDLLERGSVLENEPDATWAEPARANTQRLLRQTRLVAAHAALATGDVARARKLAEAALADDRLDEPAWRALMLAHQRTGDPGKALAAYERLRDILTAELGADPALQTRDLHLAILREQTETPQLRRDSPDREVLPPVITLAGRESEVTALTRAWTEAVAGRAALLTVTGVAGIGKTRLAEELERLALATGGEVLRARCYETERSLFLQPIIEALSAQALRMSPQVLREVAGDRAAVLAALVPDLGVALGPLTRDRGTAEIERQRTYDAVMTFLRRLSARRPVLLVIDDLHLAGLAMLELLHYVGRQTADSRLLVLVTVRTEEGEEALTRLADVMTTLDLGPLPPDAVARLAAAAGQSEHADAIVDRTGGHTLYVVESLRGLATGESQVEATLQDVVQARVRRVGVEPERVLRAAAVLGSSFEPAMVAKLIDEPAGEVVRWCEDLLRSRLVVVAGRAYEFAHDLEREVLYDTTPSPTRLAYHERAANLLTDQPEVMAAHAVVLGDLSRAARGWVRAAEAAANRAAGADAERLLDRAIDAATRADDVDALGRAYLARGRVREALTRYEDSVSDHERAASLARENGDPRLEMLALRELGGDSAAALGRPAESYLAHVEAGLRLAESLGDRSMQTDFLSRLAVLRCNELRFREGVQLGERALAVARTSPDGAALPKALDGLKTAYAYLGEVADLEPVVAELEPLLRRTGDLWRLQWMVFESSFPLIAAAEWQSASARIEAALSLNRRSGYVAYEGWFTAHLGWVARLQGRDDDAVGHGKRAMAASAGHSWWMASAAAMLATTLLELGRRQEAVDVLRSVPTASAHGVSTAYRLRYLAATAEATGSTEALTEADDLLTGIDAPTGSAWLLGIDAYLGVARAWLGAGQPGQASTAINPLLMAADRVGCIPALAEGSLIAGRCATLSGDTAAARTALERARSLAERHRMAGLQRASAELLDGLA